MSKNRRRKVRRFKRLRALILLGLLIILIFFLGKRILSKSDRLKTQEKNNTNTLTVDDEDSNQVKKPINGEEHASQDEQEAANQDNEFVEPTDTSNTHDVPSLEEEPETLSKTGVFDHLANADAYYPDAEVRYLALPASLQESISKYPETRGEILKYTDWQAQQKSYDLSGQYQKGELPRLIQWDSRWGFNKIQELPIAYAGCGPVALNAIYIYYTGDTSKNPVNMSQWANDMGYYSDAYGSSWTLFDNGPAQLGLTSHLIDISNESFKQAIDEDKMIVLNVGPGDFTKGGHYVILHDYDANGELIIHDVNSPKNSEKSWDFNYILPQIKQAWAIYK